MTIPDPALVLMVGPSGSGKSTWARSRFRVEEIVSSDELRSRLGSGPADLDASADAFEVLETIATRRVGRRLLTVVDSLGFDAGLRVRMLAVAAAAGVPAVAVVVRTPAALCRERNRGRVRPVPASVLNGQIGRASRVVPELEEEGWTIVQIDGSGDPVTRVRKESERAERLGRDGLRFHLHVSRFPTDELAATVTEAARLAEEVGFAGLSVMDHLVQIPQVGREWDPMPESLTLLTHLGAVTERCRLTVLVSAVTLRHPVLLGRQLATLDVLTGGRVTCGLGAAWFEPEHRAYGLEFPPAGRRLDLLEDVARLLPVLWGPGSPEFEGRMLTVPKAICYPRPIQQRLPILIGGGGERTLRIAVAHGDAWNVRSERFAERREVVLAHCRALDRDPDTLTATVLDVTVCGRDRSEVADLVEARRGSTSAATFSSRHSAGIPPAQIDRFRRLEADGARDVYVSLVDSDLHRAIDRFAPVVAAFS